MMSVIPNERHPAGGPGSEMRLGVSSTATEYRGRPRAGTVLAEILAALEAGRSLTSGDAWQEFGGARLAADVYRLRKLGWPIVAQEIEVPCRGSRTAKVARYRLVEGAMNGQQEKMAW
jgi:hypothetical protein